MSDAREERAESIFHTAREQPADQRDAYLAAACGGDAALEQEVRSLLEADHHLGDFLARPPVPPAPDRVGTRVGPFVILRRLDAGGMGTVYEAEQESPRRRVALKLLHPRYLSPAARRRFAHESEILARLEHPGIARVFAAGVHEEPGGGVPWLAMELVPQARPLSEAARELDLVGRIDLFARACDAVQHAHQRGILHRDLKPANILVDARGEPRLIDFGVARVTDPGLALSTLHTAPGLVIGTLAYMSPEQCDGDPEALDTRSDVYSLGVVLYELLCGVPPFELSETSLAGAARAIHERAPRRPSLADRRLRGDLETILLKALEKDRTRRYASADALAEDLRRYLRREPILARPPTLAYQLRLLARRHRPVAIASVAALVALVGGLVASLHFAWRAREERVVAERRAYVASLAAADAALMVPEVTEAYQHLTSVPPAQRAFEWSLLWHRLDPSTASFAWDDAHPSCLAISADGSVLAVGGMRGEGEGAVRLIDAATGAVLREVAAGAPGVRALAFHPGDGSLRIGSNDGAVLRIAEGEPGPTPVARHPAAIEGLAWSRDGARCLSIARDGTMRVGETAFSRPGNALCGALSPDGSRVAVGDAQGRISLLAANGNPEAELTGHPGAVTCVAFDPTGELLVAGCGDGSLRLWRVATRHDDASWTGHSGSVRGVAWSADGSAFATCGGDRVVRVWRPGRARAVAVFPGHPTSVAAIVFDPARGAFVSVDSAGNLRRWPSSYDEVPTLRGPAGLVTGIGFSSDGRRLASVSHDGTLRIWNVAGMREEARVDAPGQKFLSLAWLEGDATVVATATGGRVFLLHEGESTLGEGPPTAVSCLAVPLPGPDRFLVVDRGSVVRACAGTTVEAEWTAPGARMMSLASRADGLRAALGRDDGSISILDLRARRVLRSFAAHSAPVAAVAWSPDGTLLASGGHDGLARLWDPEDGMPRSEAREHASEVLVVGFTPDGTRWIAAGWDGQVRIRDTATGEDLLTLRGNGEPVWALAVSRAGDRLAVAATAVGAAPTIRIWNAGAPDR